jgi:putative ABC transport system substrate-binding protein
MRQALQEIGYTAEKNILIEHRDIAGKREQIPSLVSELVQLKVDVIFVRAQPAIRAAKQATKTIPIVIVTTQDPVAVGFIASLARPGGNITGVTTIQREQVERDWNALMNETSMGDFKMYGQVRRSSAHTDSTLHC